MMCGIRPPWPPHKLVTLARFGAVGAVTAGVYTLGFTVLVELGVNAVMANVAAYLTAIAIQFAGHRTFTFPSSTGLGRTGGRFLIANFFGLACSTALVIALRDGLGINALTTGVIVTLALALMNWIIFKKWVFKP